MTEAINPAPVGVGQRIETLDLLRGVAICGILLMNIPFMGMIGIGGRPPQPFAWNLDWIAWSIQTVLFEGTMRGLFTLLFGAGMLLMLRRAEGPAGEVAPIDVWTRRCLVLMALGVVQATLFLWPGEILWTYGLVGLALLAFRTARPRTLLIAAAIILAGTSAWKLHERSAHLAEAKLAATALAREARGATLGEEQQEALRGRDAVREMLTPTPAQAGEEWKSRTRFPDVLGWSTGLWSEWNLGTEAWPWLAESLGMMLIGMALFRTGILTGGAPARVYRLMMLGGYGGGLALRLFVYALGLRQGFTLDFDSIDGPAALWHDGLYETARLLITLGHVGLVVSLFRAGALGRATPLRALGRMALTVYSLQSVLTSLLFYGLGWVGAFGFATLMGIAALIWIGTALFSLWWLKRHDMGPAEQILRALAYGTLPRRERAGAAPVTAAAPSM